MTFINIFEKGFYSSYGNYLFKKLPISKLIVLSVITLGVYCYIIPLRFYRTLNDILDGEFKGFGRAFLVAIICKIATIVISAFLYFLGNIPDMYFLLYFVPIETLVVCIAQYNINKICKMREFSLRPNIWNFIAISISLLLPPISYVYAFILYQLLHK